MTRSVQSEDNRFPAKPKGYSSLDNDTIPRDLNNMNKDCWLHSSTSSELEQYSFLLCPLPLQHG